MDAHNDFLTMTVQAPPRVMDHSAKKAAGKNGSWGTTPLNTIMEHSLIEFLEAEPDIYAVSDIKVRYR